MAADSGFDTAFVREQINNHKQELTALKMFGGAAKDNDLKDDVKRALPILERHLARAKEVAAQLKMSTDSAASPDVDDDHYHDHHGHEEAPEVNEAFVTGVSRGGTQPFKRLTPRASGITLPPVRS